MKKIEKLLLTLSVVFASVFGVTQSAFAMHIMEGYLPKAHCIAWGVICIPFLVAGFISLKKNCNKREKISYCSCYGRCIYFCSFCVEDS